ncbi:hypothetical protein MPH_12395 [Macrophomina phaseolina MS6]|uniref:Acyl-CoA dehydrogenase C-terminal domain-containing protein n=1 Tax=Macrophomina phaseolina (strain MS6) TaxID=1126212 RepID=K2RCE0_MACPH|nr:hypothetical protein MPH_12395 [Macrophomina phaseolina MS6]
MLLGYHLLWSTTANVVGSAEQAEALQEYIVSNNLFLGGAVNPRDNDLKITSEGDNLVFNGFKNFNTGGVVSDLTVLEGVLEGTADHIFTVVRTQQPGIQFAHNWDNVGLRLTESGSIKIDNVTVPWTDALGWDPKTKRPDPAYLGVPYASLLLPTYVPPTPSSINLIPLLPFNLCSSAKTPGTNTLLASIQLVFSNFYLGIAQGALDYAAAYTRKNTRAWPYGGDNKDTPLEEFYVLERYGNFHAHLAAADALADRAGAAASRLYATWNYSHNGRDNRGELPARERGVFAELVASVKVVTTDTGLRVTSGVFEVTGSKATAAKVGLDRYWRDVRTHTLHDPVAYKNRELGRYVLLDEVPEPTWYT